MHKIFLGLGSNIGNKKAHIKKAILLLKEKIINIAISPTYRTKPMYFEKQDMFLNCVLRGFTNLTPQELLTFVKEIEQKVGRIKRFRNGPREIDVDILFFDSLICKEKNLEIPHPRIAERNFVLKPFVFIEKNFVHPVLKKTMKELFLKMK